MKWFKHDSSANRDAKLQKLRMRYGLEGYGLYWYCIELIAESVEEGNLTFELEHDAEIIAFNTGVHHEKVQEIMTYMVKLNLFESSDGVITCFKLAKRLDQSSTSNAHMRKLISEMKKNPDLIKTVSLPNQDSVMTESEHNHDEVMTESDQIRLDKNRLDKSKGVKAPSKKKKSPLPEIFTVTDKMKAWFEEQNFSFELMWATEKWADAMRANQSEYVDWAATWRNGMRKQQEWSNGSNNAPQTNQPPSAPTLKLMPKAGTIR